MSLTLVYIGAAAGLAPAASLRALADGGAGPAPAPGTGRVPGAAPSADASQVAGPAPPTIYIPSGLEPELRQLVAAAAGHGSARLVEVDPESHAAEDIGAVATGTESGVECGTEFGTTGDDDYVLDRRGSVEELLRLAAAGPVVVALVGPMGPQLARELRRRATAPADSVGASGAIDGPGVAGSAVAVLTVPAGPAFDDALLGQELVSLKRIVDVLRVECPWDREQTPRDIVGYTIEEVHELADAIAGADLEAEHGELGDLLLQVVLLALMLSEEGAGDLASVARDIELKLIRRHPHIFADAVADTPAEVKSRWERIKVEQEGREGIFHDVPSGFPALLYAKKLQQRAASVGFDWQSAADAFPKIAEERAELAELFAEAASAASAVEAGRSAGVAETAVSPALDPHRSDPRVAHEVGDLLFATVNVARLLHVDPELALRVAGRRFKRRVLAAAELAANEGCDWAALDWPEQEDYYQRAKAAAIAEVAETADASGTADAAGPPDTE